MLRSLFTTLTEAGVRLNLGTKFVIGRICWSRHLCKNTTDSDSLAVKNRHNIVKVVISEANQSLRVSMLPYSEKDHGPGGTSLKNYTAKLTPWRIFSAEEILEFVNATNDENPIHRTEHPLVPGCLLVESWIRDKVRGNSDVSLSFRFYGGVYSNESTYIIEDDNKLKIYTDRGLAFVVSPE